jgi:UDP-perosamine 4-acetyltransferase
VTGIVIIGGGGHARVLVEALAARRSDILGFVSPDIDPASGVMTGLSRLGDDSYLMARGPDGILLVNGIGTTGNPERRRATFDAYRKAGFAFMSLFQPSAIVASDVVLDEGAQIMARAVLQPGVRIGANTIVNTGAILDHDVSIGDHAHVAPGACLAGGVRVGDASHIGAGATIIQNIWIKDGALVGAGAVVIADVAEAVTVVGVPARAKNTVE